MGTFIILVIVAIGIFLIYWTNQITQKEMMELAQKDGVLRKKIMDKYNANKIFIHRGEEGIAIKPDENGIIIFNTSTEQVVDKKDILQSEIIEDGTTISQVSRTGQVGGALVGGMLAGGVGAVVGGLGASRTQTQKVTNIKLRLTVNDVNSPIKQITFFNKPQKEAVKKDNPEYLVSNNIAIEFQKIMEVLIKRADQEEKQQNIN
ncbi:hypothetical protein ACU3L3_06790 [Priestia endophytica]